MQTIRYEYPIVPNLESIHNIPPLFPFLLSSPIVPSTNVLGNLYQRYRLLKRPLALAGIRHKFCKYKLFRSRQKKEPLFDTFDDGVRLLRSIFLLTVVINVCDDQPRGV